MILGIDIGTTGTKTILLDNKGVIIHYSYEGYACIYPRPNYVEQSMDGILSAMIKTVRNCSNYIPKGDGVEAMCVSVQSGTMIPVKPNGEFFGNAISWLDTRCEKESTELIEKYGESFFYRKTGWKLGPSFNFIQIYKMCRDMPEETRDLTFCNVSDCIMHLLVGEYYTDINSAGNLQLLNVEAGVWDADLLDMAGIRKEQLGELVPSGAYVGVIKADAARLLGLKEGIKVYAGAQDQYCTAVGAGVHHPGDAMLSTGTSWVLMNITSKPMFDENTYPAVAKHIVGDTYASFVYTPAGGSAFKWLKNNVLAPLGAAEAISYDELTEIAEDIAPGAEHLMFLPYLGGTLYPSWNSSMKGMFHGLDFSHDRRHLTRAVLEGVAFELNLMIKGLQEQGLALEKLSALGGATRSDLWMQIVADITNLPIMASSVADVAPIGAAVMAAVGSGMYHSYGEACQAFQCLSGGRSIEPDLAMHEIYQEIYEKRYYQLNKFLQNS